MVTRQNPQCFFFCSFKNDYFILFLYSKQDVLQLLLQFKTRNKDCQNLFICLEKSVLYKFSCTKWRGAGWDLAHLSNTHPWELCQGPVQSLPGWVRKDSPYVGYSVECKERGSGKAALKGLLQRSTPATSPWEQGTICCFSKCLTASVTVCDKHTYSECAGVQSTRQGNAFWGIYEQPFSLLSLFIIWFLKGGGQQEYSAKCKLLNQE